MRTLDKLKERGLNSLKAVVTKDRIEKAVDYKRIGEIMQKDYVERYVGRLNEEIEKLARERFTINQKYVFERFKGIFKYN